MKQNMRKKALLPALAMVLASVIALSGVTYAWFTTSNTAEVKSMDVNVQTANGIQISLDGVKWRSTISGADILDAIGKTYTGSTNRYPAGTREILPVSSAGEVAGGTIKMFEGGYNANGTLWSGAAEEMETSDTNFIAFDLFFKSSAGEEGQPLTLLIGEGNSAVTGTDVFGGQADAGVENAVRVAFLPLGNAKTAGAAQALKNGTEAIIWEPNATKHVDGAEADAGKAYTTKGFNQAFEEAAEDALGDKVSEVATITTSQEIVNLKNGINKIRVYIWLEGQDVDCINPASFGDFTTTLKFSVPAAEEEG